MHAVSFKEERSSSIGRGNNTAPPPSLILKDWDCTDVMCFSWVTTFSDISPYLRLNSVKDSWRFLWSSSLSFNLSQVNLSSFWYTPTRNIWSSNLVVNGFVCLQNLMLYLLSVQVGWILVRKGLYHLIFQQRQLFGRTFQQRPRLFNFLLSVFYTMKGFQV